MTSPTRSWSGLPGRRVCTVENGGVLRGTIRTAGVEDTTGPGLAGHLIWQPITAEAVWLEPVTGNYVQAEKALLDATTELES